MGSERPGKMRRRGPRPDDWRWQVAASLRDPVQAWRRLRPAAAADEATLAAVAHGFPVRITPYYAALIDPQDADDPLARMVLPDPQELEPGPLLCDPLAEESHMPVERLVHRYRDRALLLVTLRCASYCRYCTRRRRSGKSGLISRAALAQAADYLVAHPEVRDLLVSGGDPLLLDDRVLDRILGVLRAVPSLEVLRVGTRIPAVLPQRVTPALASLLARHQPIYVSTHFNHPRELTPQAVEACARLADAGIPLANQTVLLAGVNDRPEIIEQLCRALLRARVRPYYLLQCDLVQGSEHLRTPLSRGLEIMEVLRGRLSGLALPTFVVDGPYGSGKIPLTPNYVLSWAPGRTALRNFEGQLVVYPDPQPRAAATPASAAPPARELDGVAGLLAGSEQVLAPESLERRARMSRKVPQGRG